MTDIDKLAAELRAGLEGVTPGPWFKSGVRFRMGGGEWHSIARYDDLKKTDVNVAIVGFDPRTGEGMADANWIARCSPDNIASILDDRDLLAAVVAEAQAERDEHLRLKNKLVLDAYRALDSVDAIRDGFRSAVHFVRNNAMNMERDYPEIVAAEAELAEQGVKARLASAPGAVREALSAAKDLARLAEELCGCQGDDEYVIGYLARKPRRSGRGGSASSCC